MKGAWLLASVVLAALAVQLCSAAFNKPQKQPQQKHIGSSSSSPSSAPSSTILPLRGNVYPDGLYYVSIEIGNPPKPYFLDVDTGSDLTWLQCDAPCVSCSPGPHPLYKPKKNLVPCTDPVCISLQSDHSLHRCKNPLDQCDYEIEYADQGSSLGVLVRDVFSLRFANGSLLPSLLAFGCGYDQQGASVTSPSATDGVLGLGKGKHSILSQLRDQGLTRNVIGHCFSGRNGGYLFFGDDYVPSSGMIWTPMSNSIHQYYSPGSATLAYGKRGSSVKGLQVVFDSGSSYTYFSSSVYQTLVNIVKKDLSGKLKESEDPSLPLCWRGPFRSILDGKKYFKHIVLSFTNGKKAQLEIPPEAYLIMSLRNNICLGILNGTEIGLQALNIIGDISMQDLLVVYDNEKQQIGWTPANCDKLPKSRTTSFKDGDNDERFKGGFSQPYTASMGILRDHGGVDRRDGL